MMEYPNYYLFETVPKTPNQTNSESNDYFDESQDSTYPSYSNPSSIISNSSNTTYDVEKKQKNKIAARRTRAKKTEEKTKNEQTLKKLEDQNTKLKSRINMLEPNINLIKLYIEDLKNSNDTSFKNIDLNNAANVNVPSRDMFNVPNVLFNNNNISDEKISAAVECVDQSNVTTFLNKISDPYESSLPVHPENIGLLSDLDDIELKYLDELDNDLEELNFDTTSENYCTQLENIVHAPAYAVINQSFDQQLNSSGFCMRTFPGTQETSMVISPVQNYELNPMKIWLNQVNSVDSFQHQQINNNNNVPVVDFADLIDLSFLIELDGNAILQNLA